MPENQPVIAKNLGHPVEVMKISARAVGVYIADHAYASYRNGLRQSIASNACCHRSSSARASRLDFGAVTPSFATPAKEMAASRDGPAEKAATLVLDPLLAND